MVAEKNTRKNKGVDVLSIVPPCLLPCTSGTKQEDKIKVFIGIDPGASGGMAVVSSDSVLPVLAVKMPETESDIVAFFREISKAFNARAVIERVSSSPQMGVTSAFSFGRGYGFLRACLHAYQIPFDEVLPHRWQKEFTLIKAREKNRTPEKKAQDYREKKNATKAKAQQIFPELTINHDIADACLIAEYLRRMECGSTQK